MSEKGEAMTTPPADSPSPADYSCGYFDNGYDKEHEHRANCRACLLQRINTITAELATVKAERDRLQEQVMVAQGLTLAAEAERDDARVERDRLQQENEQLNGNVQHLLDTCVPVDELHEAEAKLTACRALAEEWETKASGQGAIYGSGLEECAKQLRAVIDGTTKGTPCCTCTEFK
jgi:hypothetical protein